MAKNAPCKDCGLRYPGCHAKCEEYKEWKRPIEAEYERKNAARITDEMIHEGHYRGFKRYKNGGKK